MCSLGECVMSDFKKKCEKDIVYDRSITQHNVKVQTSHLSSFDLKQSENKLHVRQSVKIDQLFSLSDIQ